MKKSTILSLATAIAVVGTSAFTFAVWDETTASETATLTVGSPVKNHSRYIRKILQKIHQELWGTILFILVM